MFVLHCTRLNSGRAARLLGMQGLEIRPIVESDMALLRAHFYEGTPEQPDRGLARQRDGTGEFLIAFLQGVPVGYLAVDWEPESHSPPSWGKDVANLQDFVVLEAWRSNGIGTQMVHVAEEMARQRGFRRLSLGVGVDNPRARSLYERLGYRDAGLPPVEDGGSFRLWDGSEHEWRETWRFMVKELSGSSADVERISG
jgi:ribosomal protein S18 acetylase RimI-like enzyme